MQNRNVPFFRAYLKNLGACCSYAECARRCGVSEAWVYKVIDSAKAARAASPDGPSIYLFEEEEGDGQPLWFMDHLDNVLRRSIEEIESFNRERVARPRVVPTLFQGAKVAAKDPLLYGRPDLVELLGLPDDLLRDANGAVVWETQEILPPVELVSLYLGAYARRLFGKKLEVDQNTKLSGGVLISGGQQAIAKPVELEVVENMSIQEAEFSELPVSDTDPAETPTAPDYADEPEEPTAEPAPVPSPGPVIRTATPPEYAPGPNPLVQRGGNRPLTPEEKAVLARTLPNTNERPK
jgi:hypothetical protein